MVYCTASSKPYSDKDCRTEENNVLLSGGRPKVKITKANAQLCMCKHSVVPRLITITIKVTSGICGRARDVSVKSPHGKTMI